MLVTSIFTLLTSCGTNSISSAPMQKNAIT